MLLSRLSAEDFGALCPILHRAALAEGQVVLAPTEPIGSIWFPEDGIVSFHDLLEDGTRVGVGIIGFEGMTGWPALLGCDRSPHEAKVAIGGCSAVWVAVDDLVRICSERPSLNTLLLRYVHCFVSQLGRTILSNLRDPVEKRLARWLLMNHDRLSGDEIHLTHDQLGVMLGVRRASVTDTLHVLEGEHLVRSRRGVIHIRDRTQLVVFAGESYGFAEAEYARFIAPFAKGPNQGSGQESGRHPGSNLQQAGQPGEQMSSGR